MTGDMLFSMLPDTMPEEQRAALAEGFALVEPSKILEMFTDALAARALLDQGDRAGALAIMAPYREMAHEAGLDAMFEDMLGSI